MPDVEVPDPDEVKEKAGDPFTRAVALFVAVYAVVLAVAGAGGSNAGKDMLMEQQEASNRWAQYQAKSIREALYLNELERREVDLAGGSLAGDAHAKAEKAMARIRAKLDEYKVEKEQIAADARKHEADRDAAKKKDPYFDLAEVALQIAIVLSSVAMLSGRRWPFYASLVLAVVGAALAANGFFLFDGGRLLGD